MTFHLQLSISAAVLEPGKKLTNWWKLTDKEVMKRWEFWNGIYTNQNKFLLKQALIASAHWPPHQLYRSWTNALWSFLKSAVEASFSSYWKWTERACLEASWNMLTLVQLLQVSHFSLTGLVYANLCCYYMILRDSSWLNQSSSGLHY